MDTKLRTNYKRFLRQLKRHKIPLSSIRFLLLTHHHSDHSGLIAKLREEADIQLICHQKSVQFLEQGVNEEESKSANGFVNFIMRIIMKLLPTDFPKIALTKNDIIIKGEKSDILRELLDLDATIIHTPGSTPDNISIIFDDGKAIIGDVAVNILKFTGLKNRPPLIDNYNQLLESWNNLIKYGAKELYPSHGRKFSAIELLENKEILEKKIEDSSRKPKI